MITVEHVGMKFHLGIEKINTFKDHRIAMAFSTLNLMSDEKIKLDNEDCINVSFPGYFDLIKNLTK